MWHVDSLPTQKGKSSSCGGCSRSHREHRTKNSVRNTVATLIGRQELLLAAVKRRMLVFFGPMTQLNKDYFSRYLEGSQWCSGQRKNWTGHPMKDLLTITQNRKEWKALLAAMSIHVLNQWQVPVKGWLYLNGETYRLAVAVVSPDALNKACLVAFKESVLGMMDVELLQVGQVHQDLQKLPVADKVMLYQAAPQSICIKQNISKVLSS